MMNAHEYEKSEKSTFSRFIPFLLILALAATGMSMADCSDAASLNGICGEGLSWELDQHTETLTINGNGFMYDYGTEEHISAPWKAPECGNINSIMIGEGVLSVGSQAFSDTGVRNVFLPTGLKSIGALAFSGCTALSIVNLPDSLEYIDDGAFSGCSSVKSFRIPAATVNLGYGCFYGCRATYAVDENNRVYGAYDGMLIDCRNSFILAASPDVGPICTIPDFIESIGPGAFMNNTNLTVVKNCSFDKLYSVQVDAFKGCTNLKEFGSSQFSDLKVIQDGAFEGCTSLITAYSSANLACIGDNAFKGCHALPYIKFNNLQWVGDCAFEECENFDANVSPEHIGEGAFRGCTSLTQANLSYLDKGILAAGVFDGCASLNDVYGIWNLTELGDFAFRGCASMQTADLTSAVHFGKDVFRGAFGMLAVLINPSVTSLPANTFTPDGPCYVICSPDVTLEQNIGSGFFHYSYQVHTVTFLDTDGEIFIQYKVRFVDGLPLPDACPVMESDEVYDHPFTGWECEEECESVTHDLTLTPTFGKTLHQYSVKWYNGGNTFESGTAYYGDVIYKPLNDPAKRSTASTDFTFIGWNGYTEGMKVTEDVRFDAMYSESVRQYLIRFVDSEGITVQETLMDYGADIVEPETEPAKASDSAYDYEFTGWKELFEDTKVEEDMTFKPAYKKTDRMYTITFLNDGEVWSTQKVKYNDHVKNPSEKPEREPDNLYQYRFSGWDGRSMNDPVRKDRTYTAQYVQESRQFTVTYYIDDHGSQKFTVGYGDPVPVPAPVEDWTSYGHEYHVTGWTERNGEDPKTVTSDLFYEAEVESRTIPYEVCFTANGKMCQQKMLPYGSVIECPADPVKPSSGGNVYVFAGWNGYTEGMTVTGPATFDARFDERPGLCKVVFVSEGRTVSETQVPYGTIVVCPEDPVKDDPMGIGYGFTGWNGYTEGMAALHDLTFTAEFSAGEDVEITFMLRSEIISSAMYPKGTVIVPPADPEYSAGGFTFDGWEGYTEGMLALEDTVFKGMYHDEYTFFEAEFVADGVTVSKDYLRFGEDVELPDDRKVPVKDGCLFTGWDGYTEGMKADSDMRFEAVYTEAENTCKVVFCMLDTPICEKNVIRGSTVEPPEIPDEMFITYDITFIGWNGYTEGMTADEDLRFDAEFRMEISDDRMTKDNAGEFVYILPGCSLCIDGDVRDRICSRATENGKQVFLCCMDAFIAMDPQTFGSIEWSGITMTCDTVSEDGCVMKYITVCDEHGCINDRFTDLESVSFIVEPEDIEGCTDCVAVDSNGRAEMLDMTVAVDYETADITVKTDRLGGFVFTDAETAGQMVQTNGEEDSPVLVIAIAAVIVLIVGAIGAAVYFKRR